MNVITVVLKNIKNDGTHETITVNGDCFGSYLVEEVIILKLTRISTEHYNGQSSCKRCNPTGSYSGYVNWACMMVEFAEIKGHYCPKCAKEIEEEYLKEGEDHGD